MNDKLFTLTGVPVSQIVERLAEPFEPQAYRGVPGAADLTDINTGYMIERATQVFGLRGLGWKLEYEPQNMLLIGLGEGKRLTAHLKYALFSYALVNDQDELSWYGIITGGASTNDFAYAEEGARTAAIGAALKSLCFQLAVYKGQLDHHNATQLLTLVAQPGGNGGEPRLAGNGHGGNGTAANQSTEHSFQEMDYPVVAQLEADPGGRVAEDPGEYVIHFGKAYSGWTLRRMVQENPRGAEAGLTALRWYASEMKPCSAPARLDQAAAQKYLAVLEADTRLA
jgi:hypothetical protein